MRLFDKMLTSDRGAYTGCRTGRQANLTSGTRSGGAGEHPRALSGPPTSPVRVGPRYIVAGRCTVQVKRPRFRRASVPPTSRVGALPHRTIVPRPPFGPGRPPPEGTPHLHASRGPGGRTRGLARCVASPTGVAAQRDRGSPIGFPRPCSPPRPLVLVI